MNSRSLVRKRWRAGMLAFILLGSIACAAQRDSPYVPTPPAVVDAMLALAQVHPGDYVIDLGSGDGRIVIAAAKKYGSRGLGVDWNAELIAKAGAEAKRQGVSDRVEFVRRDIFDTDFSRATVLTLYLLQEANMRLRPKVLKLSPGTRVVAHDFHMGEDWEPDAKRTLSVPEKTYGPPSSTLYLWIVPAEVQGRWRFSVPVVGGEQKVELELDQRQQRVFGNVTVGGRQALLVNPRLKGSELAFGIVDDYMPRHEFSGTVTGDRVDGVMVVDGRERKAWQAARVSRPR
jgi:SAM-dependent methyltransferase